MMNMGIRQGRFIYIADFIPKGNAKSFTEYSPSTMHVSKECINDNFNSVTK